MDTAREKIRELLSAGSAGLVIGYGERHVLSADGTQMDFVAPVFLTSAEGTETIVWNHRCVKNLVTYLTKKECKSPGKTAIMVKPCDLKALKVLLQENQVDRGSLYIIGLTCNGMFAEKMGVYKGYMAEKCARCLETHGGTMAQCPKGDVDLLVDTPPEGNQPPKAEEKTPSVNQIEEMTPQERWEFWQSHFQMCLRCYACRSACPLCYCEQCITDMSQPQWIDKSPHLKGNFVFHIIRAFHLTGRCVECGECERVCPMGIPLMLLNKKMIKVVKDLYDYESGTSPEKSPLLSQFRTNDDQSFIK